MRTMPSLLLPLFLAAISSADAPSHVNGFGMPNAPILIEVYSDFQCAGCKVLHDKTLPAVNRDFVAKGKVYLIQREFPLPGHAHAKEAARFACAAGRLGAYQQAADALFAHQEAWAQDGKVDETVCAGLKPEQAKKVRALAKDPGVIASIDRDVAAGMAAGINATPTMIVTYKLKRYPLKGPVDYDFLRRFLDGLLEK